MHQRLDLPQLKWPQKNPLYLSKFPAQVLPFSVQGLLSASAQLNSVMDGQTAQMDLTRVTVLDSCCHLPKWSIPSVTRVQSFVTMAKSAFCLFTYVMEKETVWMDPMNSDVQKPANQVI